VSEKRNIFWHVGEYLDAKGVRAHMMVCTKEFHMTKIQTNSEPAAAKDPIAMGAPRWWYPGFTEIVLR